MPTMSEMFGGAAAVYDRFVGRYGIPLARATCEQVGVVSGWRALDVGCGTGALTAALADLLGPENVVGVDPSESFVEAARSRVPGAQILLGSAESLPFPDGEFDTAIAQLVVPFMSDAPGGLAEMRRVTRPGSPIAGTVWDYAGEMTLLRTFWDAAISLDPAAADEAEVLRYGQPDTLGELWRGAGLEDVEVTPLFVEAPYEDFDDLWSPFPTGVGPAGAYAAGLDADAQERLRIEVRRRLGDPEGPFTLSARAWCAVGRNA
jgi:SAM-dependent methyltransferase